MDARRFALGISCMSKLWNILYACPCSTLDFLKISWKLKVNVVTIIRYHCMFHVSSLGRCISLSAVYMVNTRDSPYIAVQYNTMLHTVQKTSRVKLQPYFEITKDSHCSPYRASYGCLSWVIWLKVTARYRECIVFGKLPSSGTSIEV